MRPIEDPGIETRLEVGRYSLSGHERDRLYVNDGTGRFVEAGYVAGTDRIEDGREIAILDADADGVPDVLANHTIRPTLLRNRNPTRARFLGVRLEGTTSNRDAVGAVATLKLRSGRRLARIVKGGHGHRSQNTRTLFFGLGRADEPASLEIAWPRGARERLAGLPSGGAISIREGEGRFVLSERPARANVEATQRVRDRHDTALWTADRLPLAAVSNRLRAEIEEHLATAEIGLLLLSPRGESGARDAIGVLSRITPELAARGARALILIPDTGSAASPGDAASLARPAATRGELSALAAYQLPLGTLLLAIDRERRVRLRQEGPLHAAQLLADLDELSGRAEDAAPGRQ